MIRMLRWAVLAAAVPGMAAAEVPQLDGPPVEMRVGGKAGPASCWTEPKPCPSKTGETNYCSDPGPCLAGMQTVVRAGQGDQPAIYARAEPPPIAAAEDAEREEIARAWASGECLVVSGWFTFSGAAAAPLLTVGRIIGPCRD